MHGSQNCLIKTQFENFQKIGIRLLKIKENIFMINKYMYEL